MPLELHEFKEKQSRLVRPFDDDQILWRVATSFNKKQEGKRVYADLIIVPYVDARHVIHRLNDVLGIDNWSRHIELTPNGVICNITIHLVDKHGNRCDVTKGDAAQYTNIEPAKGGASRALVRAAVNFGIGIELYDIEESIKVVGSYYGKMDGKNEKWVKWDFDRPRFSTLEFENGYAVWDEPAEEEFVEVTDDPEVFRQLEKVTPLHPEAEEEKPAKNDKLAGQRAWAHKLGVLVFGKEWDNERHRLCYHISKQTSQHIADLNAKQLITLRKELLRTIVDTVYENAQSVWEDDWKNQLNDAISFGVKEGVTTDNIFDLEDEDLITLYRLVEEDMVSLRDGSPLFVSDEHGDPVQVGEVMWNGEGAFVDDGYRRIWFDSPEILFADDYMSNIDIALVQPHDKSEKQELLDEPIEVVLDLNTMYIAYMLDSGLDYRAVRLYTPAEYKAEFAVKV